MESSLFGKRPCEICTVLAERAELNGVAVHTEPLVRRGPPKVPGLFIHENTM